MSATSNLSKLTLVPLRRRAKQSPTDLRRAKLSEKLSEQLALAAAYLEGRSHVVMKSAWQRDAEGNKQRVQRPKLIRPWWWQEGNQVSFVVRYGARPLTLGKGDKRAISVPQMAALPEAISTIIAAVDAGELDAAIEASLSERRGAAGKRA